MQLELPSLQQAREILSKYVEGQGLQGAPYNYVLTPKDYNLYLIESPPVEPQELESAVRWKRHFRDGFYPDTAKLFAGQTQSVTVGFAPPETSAPGGGNTGTVSIELDLSAATGLHRKYLQFEWDDAGADYNENPLGQIEFGLARSHRLLDVVVTIVVIVPVDFQFLDLARQRVASPAQ